MHDMNSGYDGYSMSKRAVEAYGNGEKPYSKWKKSDIVLDYYSILCEIYGSVRYLLEDDLYYYCRNNNLQYKV